jgi:cholesterol transport system auxiliary component
MKKLLYLFYGVLCLSIFVTACNFRETTPPIKSYFIASESVAMPRVNRRSLSSLTLKLLPVRSPVPLRTTRIYYKGDSFSLNTYAFSRWADSPSVMLQMKLVRCLEAAAIFQTVLPSTAKARADLFLDTTLYDFSHHICSGSSEGVIMVEFRIVDTLSKKVVSSFATTVRKTTPTPDAPGAVAALNRAAETLGRELVHWLKGVMKALPEKSSR